MVTVIVNYLNLIAQTNCLSSVKKRVSSRNLSISMNTSKGDFSEQLLSLADSIYSCGQTFADLTAKTENILNEARIAFKETDESAAGQFEG